MKKLVLIALLLPMLSYGQRSTAFWEIGGYLGGLNYSGNVTSTGDIGTWINEMRPEIGVLLKRNFNYRINLGAEASYGSVYAEDANHGNAERGFIVNTEMVQANIFMEINFMKFGKYFKRNANTPYIKFGIGGLFYTPTLDESVAYPENYDLFWGSHTTYNIQLAFGWKWRLSHHSFLSIDFHYHPTGTDYLEGSQEVDGTVLMMTGERQLIADPDSYYGLRLTYTFGIFKTD